MSFCIHCKSGDGRFKEISDASRVFCGRVCQGEFYLYHKNTKKIGLQDNTLIPPINDDDIIGLEASDGIRFKITRAQAMQLGTVKNLLEDIGSREYISLPNVDGPTLRWIVHYLGDPKTGKYNPIPTHTDFNNADFETLLKAANYLDFQDLLFYLYPEWVNTRDFSNSDNELKHLLPTAMYFYRGDFKYMSGVAPPRYQDFNNSHQWSILTAVSNGRTDVVWHLLQDRSVDPITAGNAPIRFAAANGYTEIMDYLLKIPRVSSTCDKHSLIHEAAISGKWGTVVRLLQERDVDPGNKDNLLFRIAAEKGNLEIMDLLLKDKRVDPRALGNYALFSAADRGDLKVVERLLQDPRIDPDVLSEVKNERIQQLITKQKKRMRLQSRLVSI